MNEFDSDTSLRSLARHVRDMVGSNGALVTEVTGHGQVVLASSGLKIPDFFKDIMPLEYSVCQHVVEMDFPLVVDNAWSHPLLRTNRATTELGVAAYLGAPIHTPEGRPIGAVCALQFRQHQWTTDDLVCVIGAADRARDLIFEQA